MTLGIRGRLALRVVLLVVPFGVLVAWLVVTLRERADIESTAAAVEQRMDEVARTSCEEHPESWPRRGHNGLRLGRAARGLGRAGWDLVPFDARYTGRTPFPMDLAATLDAGEKVASHRVHDGRRPMDEIAVRMTWRDGPCAVMLVRRPAERGSVAWTRALLVTVPVAAAASLVVLFAVGPLVGRIRKLTSAVEGRTTLAEDRSSDELGELSRAFAESRRALDARLRELELRDDALRTYVASTTHDVMLPITVLAGHLVELERATIADPKLLAKAIAETDYLAALVANMGAAAKLDAGAPHLARHATDLCGLVARVYERHAPLARRRGVELAHAVPDAPLVAHADPTLLEQAVSNLVHNAVRYVQPGGHVALLLERDGAARFVIRVLDDGPGVSDADLARLGERGFRGGDESRTRGVPGSGLGLAIARDVAARHGYALAFSKPEGGGFLATLSGSLREERSKGT